MIIRVYCICILSICLSITTNAQVDTANVIASNENCAGNSNGSILYNITGGPGPVKYTWSNGITGYATGSCTYVVTLNNPGTALSQFQVRVDVTLAAGMNADFSDVVFIDSLGNAFPFWLTDFPTATTATFWVRVPSIPTGTSVFYLSFCGSATVSQSDPVTTFEFFDNFDTGNIGSWTGTCFNINQAGESCSSAATNAQFFSSAYRILTGASSCFSPPFDGAGSNVSRTVPMVNDSLVIDFENKASASLYGFCSGGTSTTNQVLADNINLGNGVSVGQGGSCATNVSPWTTSTSLPFAVTVGSTTIGLQTYGGDCDNSEGWFDNVRVRKYRTYPPTVTLDTTPQLSLNNLPAGTYTITLMDINGLTVTRNIIVTEPLPLLLNIDSFNNSCAGSNAGMAWVSVANGTAPYTLLWSNSQTTDTITGLAPGTYSISVTDNNGCSATASTNIVATLPMQVLASADSVECFGASTGSAWVTSSGGQTPYAYAWSNGLNSDTITGIAAGAFSVTVTDANSCSASAAVTVYQPSLLSATTNAHAPACVPPNSGSAVVYVAGGTLSYSYNWSTGGSTDSLAGLNPGNYIITVTDGNNCTVSKSITVAAQPPVTISQLLVTPACPGELVGTASVQIVNGSTPYVFIWSDGETSQNATSLGVGPASLTVTDAWGCTATFSTTIPVDNFSVSVTAQPDSVVQVNTPVTLQVQGTDLQSAVWSPAVNYTDSAGFTVTVAPGLTTSYTVIATSIRGCMDTVTSKIVVQPKPLWLIPTGFSPNGDGVNDILHVTLRGPVQLVLFSVYNRWGEKVFENDNYDEGWDGYYKGIAQPVGVYIWQLRVKNLTDINHKMIDDTGNITLVR